MEKGTPDVPYFAAAAATAGAESQIPGNGIPKRGVFNMTPNDYKRFRVQEESLRINGVRSHYNVLGVASTATPAEIKRAYHRLALLLHPDKTVEFVNELKGAAEASFKAINCAYEILSNENKRREYDSLNDDEDSEEVVSILAGHISGAPPPSDHFRKLFEKLRIEALPKDALEDSLQTLHEHLRTKVSSKCKDILERAFTKDSSTDDRKQISAYQTLINDISNGRTSRNECYSDLYDLLTPKHPPFRIPRGIDELLGTRLQPLPSLQIMHRFTNICRVDIKDLNLADLPDLATVVTRNKARESAHGGGHARCGNMDMAKKLSQTLTLRGRAIFDQAHSFKGKFDIASEPGVQQLKAKVIAITRGCPGYEVKNYPGDHKAVNNLLNDKCPKLLSPKRHPIQFEGWVQKQSRYLREWRNRWLVLQYPRLFTFKSKQTYLNPTEVIDVRRAEIIDSPAVSDCRCHDFVLKVMENIDSNVASTAFAFRAPSQESKSIWVSVLKGVISSFDLKDSMLTNNCELWKLLLNNRKKKVELPGERKFSTKSSKDNFCCTECGTLQRTLFSRRIFGHCRGCGNLFCEMCLTVHRFPSLNNLGAEDTSLHSSCHTCAKREDVSICKALVRWAFEDREAPVSALVDSLLLVVHGFGIHPSEVGAWIEESGWLAVEGKNSLGISAAKPPDSRLYSICQCLTSRHADYVATILAESASVETITDHVRSSMRFLKADQSRMWIHEILKEAKKVVQEDEQAKITNIMQVCGTFFDKSDLDKEARWGLKRGLFEYAITCIAVRDNGTCRRGQRMEFKTTHSMDEYLHTLHLISHAHSAQLCRENIIVEFIEMLTNHRISWAMIASCCSVALKLPLESTLEELRRSAESTVNTALYKKKTHNKTFVMLIFAVWCAWKGAELSPSVWISLAAKCLRLLDMLQTLKELSQLQPALMKMVCLCWQKSFKMTEEKIDWKRLASSLSSENEKLKDELPALLCRFTGELMEDSRFNATLAWSSVSDILLLTQPSASLWASRISQVCKQSELILFSDDTIWKLRGDQLLEKKKSIEACFCYLASLHLRLNLNTVFALTKTLATLEQYHWAAEILARVMLLLKGEQNREKAKAALQFANCIENIPGESPKVVLECYSEVRTLLTQVNAHSNDVEAKLRRWEKKLAQWNEEIEDKLARDLMNMFSYQPRQYIHGLWEAFKVHDMLKLKVFLNRCSRRLAAHYQAETQIPEIFKARKLLGEGVTAILEGDAITGCRLLQEALTSPLADGNENLCRQQFVADVLAAPDTRATLLAQIYNGVQTVVKPDNDSKPSTLATLLRDQAELPKSFLFEGRLKVTPELTSLRKCEKYAQRQAAGVYDVSTSTYRRKETSHFSAAMTYFDLMVVAPGASAVCTSLLNASRHLLADQRNATPQNAHALRVLGSEIVGMVLGISDRLPITSRVAFYTSGVALLIEAMKVTPQGVIQEDVDRIVYFWERIVMLSTLAPTMGSSKPMMAYDATYQSVMLRELWPRFCCAVASQLNGLLSSEQYSYYCMEVAWGRNQNQLPTEQESKEESKFLNEIKDKLHGEKEELISNRETKRWAERFREERWAAIRAAIDSHSNVTLNEIHRLINCLQLPRNKEGFLKRTRADTSINKSFEFHSFDGIKISTKTGDITFMLTPSSRRQPGHFGWSDLREIFGLGSPGFALFSLDPIDPADKRYHPLQSMKFTPVQLRNTGILATMFHADYLLKFLTTGQEISAFPPFASRSTSAEGGLLSRLPKRLRDIANELVERGDGSDPVGKAHRFWIDTESLDVDIDQKEENLQLRFGNVNMRICTNPLERNALTGDLQDRKLTEDEKDSPEKKYCHAFSKNIQEFGRYFPSLLRIGELSKILIAARHAAGVKATMRAELQKSRSTKILEHSENLRKIAREFPFKFPQASNESIIREYIDKTRELNSGRGHIPYSTLRTHVINQLVDVDNQIVSQLASQFANFYGRSSNQFRQPVRNLLAYQNTEDLAGVIVNAKDRQLERAIETLETFNVPTINTSQMVEGFNEGPTGAGSCSWVPAVFNPRTRGSVYGGVSIQPKINPRSVRTNPASKIYNRPNAWKNQRANSIPNSAAQKYDNSQKLNRSIAVQRMNSAIKSENNRIASQKRSANQMQANLNRSWKSVQVQRTHGGAGGGGSGGSGSGGGGSGGGGSGGGGSGGGGRGGGGSASGGGGRGGGSRGGSSGSSRPWVLTNDGAQKVMEYEGRKYYGHRTDKKGNNLWFCKDSGGHANSAYKVFTQRGNQIVLRCSADIHGDFMPGKHESNLGLTIKLSDMKRVK
eukprot:CAMPEP_0114515296 /NCGR_PEP_ID=MMETSP0109-20121206/16654_1 /TAXON_ID=29199 /ORGANISM="Chlorarachnion reptans, Strain CCCM449" /LENGTH=2301 /DNA_ID=CAMNT_0001695479 /DNA_START=286 /DNA_END=7191 /DNA_ORIENTATION=+